MKQSTPGERDAARRRIRAMTTGSAVVAGVLVLGGAAAAAGTFAGRTVSAADSTTSTQPGSAQPTFDPNSGFQPPNQAPSGYQGGGQGGGVPSGGS